MQKSYRTVKLSDLELLDFKEKTLEEKKKMIERKLHYNSRKARTRRLIQTGALVEKYFDIEHLSIEDKEELFKLFSAYIKNNIPLKYKKQNDK